MSDNKKSPLNRTEAREYVFALLFAKTFAMADDLAEFYAAEISNTDEDFGLQADYIKNTFFGIMDNLSVIDEKIGENSQGWKLNRLSRVAISLMRLSVYEMTCSSDVPKLVAINEAIELAKKYDDDSAPAFINGVLNAAAHSIPDRECDK